MQGSNTKRGNRTSSLWARGFAAFWAALALGLVLGAGPAEAAPFAYVANFDSNTVSVIDTVTNKVVATVPVAAARWVAVTPDGKHAYVTNILSDGTVSVIDTATNTVVGTPIPVGTYAHGVAVTPDGKYAYVTNDASANVSVIATASNTVVATGSGGV